MKTSKSYSYWERRQDERLAYSERVSTATVSSIADVYDDSLERVTKRIDKIIDNYAKSIKMPADSLRERLSQHDTDVLLRDLTKDLIENGANTNENMKWLRGNYLKRISNQEAIRLQLQNERRIISENERNLSKFGYNKTIDETYKSMAKDLTGTSRALSSSAKESMLSKRWVASGNYSSRIWENTDKLSTEVDKLINSALLSGTPKHEIINDLTERYDVAKYRAETLVRTEMNYFENQTELKSYQDLGVTHYTYLATRDNRTSSTCAGLDRTRHAVKDAVPGKNYPPMHPNCRSGTIPDLEFENDYRVYKNPLTREREKTTKTYEEWLDNIEKKAEKQYNVDRDGIESTFDSNEFKQMNKMTLNDFKKVFSPQDLGLVYDYTDKLYKDVNKYFRDGEVESTEIPFKAKSINKIIRSRKLQQDVVLRRGVGGLTLKEMGIEGLGSYTLKGLTSTTIDPDTSKMFMNMKQKRKIYFEIIAPKGTKGMYIEDISRFSKEKEFLLPHNTKLIIEYIKEKEGYTHVKSRIVEE